jgi:uridine kinase
MKPIIIGVAGGSGSGKSFFAHALQNELGLEKCALLYQDNYYIDQSDKFDHDGGAVNFDHPSSIDFPLLGKHLGELKNGHDIAVPLYDFATHTRKEETLGFPVKPVILVDGILILQQEVVRTHFDHCVFVDTPEELRFQRRLERDVNERGRTAEGVKAQFFNQVIPMHNEFVQPSMQFANHIITNQSEFDALLDKFNNILG